MSFKILKECIKIAHKSRKKIGNKKDHHLCAIAQRFDGTFTSAINGRCLDRTPEVHAEYKALLKAGKGSRLWVGRALANGEWGMAKPCKKCMTFIKNMGVTTVYYTIKNNEYGVIKLI